tara:strand:+ start:186 stop:644 length:459 start_codon:yes stop_codon:yes gene_type:complete
MSDKPERYDEFISSIGSVETRPEFPYYKIRPREGINHHRDKLNEWKEINDKVIGFPSERGKLRGFPPNCYEYGIENGDILILDKSNWVFRIKDSNYPEKEILRELIIEMNDCFATILELWGALENNDKKLIHSGMGRLHEAQAKLIELNSKL